MVSLREIRKRIHSANNIKQITKAMELVAGAQLHKAELKVAQSRLYISKVKQMIDNISLSGDVEHSLLDKRESGKIGLIIVGGDRGLSGSYNENVINEAEKFLKQHSSQDIEIIAIGRKIIEHFHKTTWKIGQEIKDWGRKITFQEVDNLAKELLSRYISNEFNEIWVIYTSFISLFSRKIKIEKLLNIESSPSDEAKKTHTYILEPNIEEIYHELVPRWLSSKFLNILNEAYASELAARVFSMKMATKNAQEMIERLTLERNKVRQANITREITEIITGAESI
jgi:F-type H+-transporting ATPase subunit gamma